MARPKVPYDLNPKTVDEYAAAAGAAEERRRQQGSLTAAEEVQVGPELLADMVLTIAGLTRQVALLQSTQRQRRKPT